MRIRHTTLFGSHGNDLVVANALIWAALVFAVVSTVQGTGYGTRLLPLVVAAALGSVLVLTYGVRTVLRESETDC